MTRSEKCVPFPAFSRGRGRGGQGGNFSAAPIFLSGGTGGWGRKREICVFQHHFFLSNKRQRAVIAIIVQKSFFFSVHTAPPFLPSFCHPQLTAYQFRKLREIQILNCWIFLPLLSSFLARKGKTKSRKKIVVSGAHRGVRQSSSNL